MCVRRARAGQDVPRHAAAGAGLPRTAEVRASDGISPRVRRGEIFGLLGPNGAGKSTLVRQLTGLMRPDAGSVEVLGHDLVRHPERAARLLGYLGQESTALDELTVALAAETTGRLRGLHRARRPAPERDAVLEELGLTEIAGRPLKKLSGGQRRLACFAATLVGDRGRSWCWTSRPPGMDPVARRAVWAAVDRRRAERGATVLLVTHNVIEAETVLDRVAVLDQRPGHRLRHPRRAQGARSPARYGSSWSGASRPRCDVPEVAALRRVRPGVRAAAGCCGSRPTRPGPPSRP